MEGLKNIKLDKVFIYLIFTEIILGGMGNLFGRPIRLALFAGGLLVAAYYYFRREIVVKRRTMLYVIAILGYTAYGSILGLIRGNNVKDILSNANVFITILYVFIFIILINGRKEIINKLISLFIIYNSILGIAVYVVFKTSFYQLLNGIYTVPILEHFETVTRYGLITGLIYNNTYARVYIGNGIFLQVALAICLIRLAYKNKIKVLTFENLNILFITMGIIATSTRGYWLGVGVVAALILFFIRKTSKKALIVNLLFILIAVSIAFTSPTFGADVSKRHGFMASVIDRTIDSGDFSPGELSNSIRNIQTRHLLQNIKKHPIVGSGFGARIEAYEKETHRNSLNYELYYFELLFKTGIIGMLILFAGFGHMMYEAYKIGKEQCSKEELIILKGWTLGFISAGFSSATNPYFAGAHGFFIPVFLIILLDIYDKKGEKSKLFRLGR
jgi:hypothetical protein